MLLEKSDREAGCPQRIEDLGEAVVEADDGGRSKFALVVDVRLRFGEHGAGGFEVGELDDNELVRAFITHRPQHRVALAHEKETSRLQQLGDHLGPASDVGQPAQCSDAGVDEVELPRAQRADGGVDVALHVVDVCITFRRQSARHFQRRT